MMNMKTDRRIVLAIGLFLMALAGLFPPWVSSVDVLENNELKPGYFEPGGRRFLFLPPKPVIAEKRLVVSRSIDYGRLTVEWMVLGFSTLTALGVLLILEDRKAQRTEYRQPRAA